MGSKKFCKKLSLSKKTIANLNNGEMKNVQGGTTCGTCACPTYGGGSCITVCYTFYPTACPRPMYCM
jgi:natural product precursor